MKKILFTFAAALIMVACGGNAGSTATCADECCADTVEVVDETVVAVEDEVPAVAEEAEATEVVVEDAE